MSAEIKRAKENNITAPLCACGCGNHVSRSAANSKQWNKYIHGHNGKGRPRPEHVRKKISKSHFGIGRGESRSPSTEFKSGQRSSPETEFQPGHKFHLGKKRSDAFRQKMAAHYKNQRYTVSCDYCGRPLKVIEYKIKNSNHAFCDRTCSSSYFSGDRNNKWKGGITPENVAIRGSVGALYWKKAVMSRDGYKCYLCGTGGRLHAHHIHPFAEYEKLRFDVDNGITLCPDCHKWCHAEEICPIVYQVSKTIGII